MYIANKDMFNEYYQLIHDNLYDLCFEIGFIMVQLVS